MRHNLLFEIEQAVTLFARCSDRKHLSPSQRRRFWMKCKRQVEGWYFDFFYECRPMRRRHITNPLFSLFDIYKEFCKFKDLCCKLSPFNLPLTPHPKSPSQMSFHVRPHAQNFISLSGACIISAFEPKVEKNSGNTARLVSIGRSNVYTKLLTYAKIMQNIWTKTFGFLFACKFLQTFCNYEWMT